MLLMMHEYNMGRSPDGMILKQDIEVVGESPASLPPTQYQSHMDWFRTEPGFPQQAVDD